MYLIDLILKWWRRNNRQMYTTPVVNITPSPMDRRRYSNPQIKVVHHKNTSPNLVKADNTSLALKRGWVRKGNGFAGYYRTSYGAWKGEIFRRGDKFNVFIYNPPVNNLKNHSRWPCFEERERNRWYVNLAVQPQDGDVGAIIFNVERIIIESFQLV